MDILCVRHPAGGDLGLAGVDTLAHTALLFGLELRITHQRVWMSGLKCSKTHLRVQEHESALGRLCSTDDGEHALSSLVVRDLGDRDTGAGEATDLGDLGTTTAAAFVNDDSGIL
jgi:hypothetical protein